MGIKDVVKAKYGEAGRVWFEKSLLPRFAPVTVAPLLGTLVLIFAFQSASITGRLSNVILIAIPITIQVYFSAGLTYMLMKCFKVEHSVAAPGALSKGSEKNRLKTFRRVRDELRAW